MVLITIFTGAIWGESKPPNITGGAHCSETMTHIAEKAGFVNPVWLDTQHKNNS